MADQEKQARYAEAPDDYLPVLDQQGNEIHEYMEIPDSRTEGQ